LVLPLWLVNMDTTDFAPTLVNSEGDFWPLRLPRRLELEVLRI
jgi:hypothetical protein